MDKHYFDQLWISVVSIKNNPKWAESFIDLLWQSRQKKLALMAQPWKPSSWEAEAEGCKSKGCPEKREAPDQFRNFPVFTKTNKINK